jgi:predicted dehydrogenase
MSATLPMALVGAGHLGTFHAQRLHELDPAEPRWIIDRDRERAENLATSLGVRAGTDFGAALAEVAAVIIATPTETHFDLAARAIEAGRHVLVEKPMTRTVEEGERLVKLARAAGVKLQVGHVERFNPIFLAVREQIGRPAFVEAERLAPFVPRSMDIDVILDLMIHDLDILLSLVPERVASLDAVGVAVLTQREDIANARLRFTNGTVANLTASRVSREKVRKLRFFGPSGYLSLDMAERRGRRALIVADRDGEVVVPGVGHFRVAEEILAPTNGDALTEQMRAFQIAILENTPPVVSGEDAVRVLRIAGRIQQEVVQSLEEFRRRGSTPDLLAGAGPRTGSAIPDPEA